MSATDRIRSLLKSASNAPWWFRDGTTIAVLGEGDDGIECEVGTPLGCGDARADACLIAEFRNHAEALCDLADAARRRRAIGTCEWCYDGDCTGTGICPCDHACHDAEHQADVAIDQALALLDGDGP